MGVVVFKGEGERGRVGQFQGQEATLFVSCLKLIFKSEF